MTVHSLDVDAFIVEWRKRMAFEKYQGSHLEKCVTRYIINRLRSRIGRWYDQKEATLKADGEKYRVSQLEECVKRHAINMLRLHNLHVHVKPRVWRWYDRKEATLGAYREKYLVKYLVECVTRQAASITVQIILC